MQDTAHPANRLLTRSEVEEIYGVSRRYLEVAATRGEGPVYVRIGRTVRYRPEDLSRWIDTCAVDPKEPGRG